jgi:hypothetical protein
VVVDSRNGSWQRGWSQRPRSRTPSPSRDREPYYVLRGTNRNTPVIIQESRRSRSRSWDSERDRYPPIIVSRRSARRPPNPVIIKGATAAGAGVGTAMNITLPSSREATASDAAVLLS